MDRIVLDNILDSEELKVKEQKDACSWNMLFKSRKSIKVMKIFLELVKEK